MAMERRTITDYVYPILGSMGGILTGEFFGEWAGKAANKTGWDLAWLKLFVKGLFGGAMLYLSRGVAGAKAKEALSFAGASCIGSWVLDALAAAYPGGIPGLAAALTLKRAATAVAPVMPTLQKAVPFSLTAPVAPAPTAAPSPTPAPSGQFF